MKVGYEVEVLGLTQVCSLSHFLYIGLLSDAHASLLFINMPFADFFCFYNLSLELVMCNGVFFDGHYYIVFFSGFGKLLVLKWCVSLPLEGGPLKTAVARVKMLKKILDQGYE